MTPLDLIGRFGGLNALVIGEAMLDRYLTGHVERLCREAPVPIVSLDGGDDVPGGGANAAAAAAALGARTRFLSATGSDDAGRALDAALVARGVDTRGLLRLPGRVTMVKQRVSGNGQLLLRLDQGSEGDLDAVSERRLIELIEAGWADADVVILSDYGYGVLTPAVVAAVAEQQRADPRVLMLDAKHAERFARVGVTAVKPNYAEALALLDLAPVEGDSARAAQMSDARERLWAATGAEIVAVTLDTAGAVILERGHDPWRTFTRPAPNDHAAGAGDVFAAAFALALAAGAQTREAADIASAAATVCVSEAGTTLCDSLALTAHVAGREKLADAEQAQATVLRRRAAGERLVFTNGCFDILHHGHVSYLNRAKALGDLLVVGLNSDASVRALKGPERPINPEGDRAAVLAALSCVDLVVLFDEPTPARLIEQLRPDVFVKGGDYTLDTLPEAPLVKRLGGEVKLLPFLDQRSTTRIIERIRAAGQPLAETA